MTRPPGKEPRRPRVVSCGSRWGVNSAAHELAIVGFSYLEGFNNTRRRDCRLNNLSAAGYEKLHLTHGGLTAASSVTPGTAAGGVTGTGEATIVSASSRVAGHPISEGTRAGNPAVLRPRWIGTGGSRPIPG